MIPVLAYKLKPIIEFLDICFTLTLGAKYPPDTDFI